MDKELLLEIFKIPAPSTREQFMQEFIENFLKKHNIPCVVDTSGNIYNISYKNIPLLSAHMDCMQDSTDEKLTNFIKIRGNTLSGYGCIGADDKCGIYIILDLLKEKKLNFVFSVGEEIGAHGIQFFTAQNDLSHIPYGLVLDRRGKDDIICANVINEYGTKGLEAHLVAVGKVFGYKSATGTFSDADFLSDEISCANLSVGYYNPHTKQEFVKIKELKQAVHFVHAITKNVNKKFKKPSKYEYDGVYGYGHAGYAGRKKYTEYNDVHNYSEEELYGHDKDGYFFCVFCKEENDVFYLSTLNRYVCRKCAGNFINDIEYMKILDNSYPELRDSDKEFML